MNALMTPAAPESGTTSLSGHHRLTREEVNRILARGDGVSRLLVIVRDSDTDPNAIADAIIAQQNRTSNKAKRILIALFDTILPG